MKQLEADKESFRFTLGKNASTPAEDLCSLTYILNIVLIGFLPYAFTEITCLMQILMKVWLSPHLTFSRPRHCCCIQCHKEYCQTTEV